MLRFGWVRLIRYEEMRNRYEACKANAQATIESLHKIIEFADLRRLELEQQLETIAEDANKRLEANGRRIRELEQENNALKAKRTRTASARPENLPPTAE